MVKRRHKPSSDQRSHNRPSPTSNKGGVTTALTAARHAIAYYGQLARAKLGLDRIELRSSPQPDPCQRPAFVEELVRTADMLYAIGERDVTSFDAELRPEVTQLVLAIVSVIIALDLAGMLIVVAASVQIMNLWEVYRHPNFSSAASLFVIGYVIWSDLFVLLNRQIAKKLHFPLRRSFGAPYHPARRVTGFSI